MVRLKPPRKLQSMIQAMLREDSQSNCCSARPSLIRLPAGWWSEVHLEQDSRNGHEKLA